MWKLTARGFDWLLSLTLSRMVRPRVELPPPTVVPSDPDEVDWPAVAPVDLQPAGAEYEKLAKEIPDPVWEFVFPSPVDSPWEENQVACGLAVGPIDAKRVTILLHGAYEDGLKPSVWMADSFARQGHRVFMPVAPCHLKRTPGGLFSGSPMFWSARRVVAGVYQWLAEIRGLMGYLRREGVEEIGLYGYSLGSMVAGLAGTLWDDVDSLALLSPVGSHAEAIQHSRIASRIWPWMRDLSADDIALLDRWAPVRRQPRVDRMGFFITMYDKLQPTALQERWWDTWGQPQRWDYHHAHLSVHYSKAFYRDRR
jgi:dienelactone hydrolase